ncbi:MAG TPA: carbamoyltransferase HypF [Tepidisphaeraceae bacterium]|jgi:hydrogenase maturation protein HypF
MERRAIAIYGTVQGVGFRPFVHELASRLSLDGFVKNRAGGVQIEIEGEAGRLDEFLARLTQSPPPLARIEEISWQRRAPRRQRGFEIETSEAGEGPVGISPDIAVCEACLAEMFDPTDRRYRYPFINCTHCGPRLTIVRSAPYDRQRTTMAEFVMCQPCRAEYENPRDRRFHAQPVACASCGPRLTLLSGLGEIIEQGDPLELFCHAIVRGEIGALKGLGGYHLVCDATNDDAVAELRRRKARYEKPLAVMVADLAQAKDVCEISEAEAALLGSPGRPIVLLRKSGKAKIRGEGIPGPVESRRLGRTSELISPRNPMLGIMLPYTPVHHLLIRKVGRPLVMTSGNCSDEPIAYEDADAVERLHGIADLFLAHNRAIHVRCDDSVTRIIGSAEAPVRRSRGYAPQPIALPFGCASPILAVGGQLKGTFVLGQDRRAILSQHMGDLDHYSAYRAFVGDVGLYENLFCIKPRLIAHDMHPDYASTRYAAERNLHCIAVQHHHAHIASCMAEHGLNEQVIGVAFDGSGFGPDGTVWGGEFFIADYAEFRRVGHLRYVPLPGGEQAVRQPWRMAASYLMDAEAHCDAFASRQSPANLRTVEQMIQKKINSPLTSSIGRLFDAVASLCGLRDIVSYEGQAAIELEALATQSDVPGVYPYEISFATIVDTRPMIQAIAADVDRKADPCCIARKFHSTLVQIIQDICQRLRKVSGLKTVVLSGGVFMNALLSLETERSLSGDGFVVYCHRKVPCNDGGLCLGQLAVAAAQCQT